MSLSSAGAASSNETIMLQQLSRANTEKRIMLRELQMYREKVAVKVCEVPLVSNSPLCVQVAVYEHMQRTAQENQLFPRTFSAQPPGSPASFTGMSCSFTAHRPHTILSQIKAG
jgi:hypothetical protein